MHSVILCRLRAGFHWITGFFPGSITTQNRSNLLETVVQQNARRTGARFFGWSGTVGNDPGLSAKFFLVVLVAELGGMIVLLEYVSLCKSRHHGRQ